MFLFKAFAPLAAITLLIFPLNPVIQAYTSGGGSDSERPRTFAGSRRPMVSTNTDRPRTVTKSSNETAIDTDTVNGRIPDTDRPRTVTGSSRSITMETEGSSVVPDTDRPRSVGDGERLTSDLAAAIKTGGGSDPSLGAEPAPAPPLTLPIPAQPPPRRSRAGVFDLFLMLEYRRDEIKFTGEPTTTFIFPNPVPPFSVPDAPIHFIPGAFEPNHEQIVGYVSAQIKDYGFERLRFNTHASFRYLGDLDGTTEASPFLTIRDQFTGRRILEPLSFYTDMTGFFSEDRLSRFNFRVGRQFVYGAESVRLDGATISINHPRFDLDLFGGRRVSFYSEPGERAVFGENLLVRATERTSLRYDFLHYIDTSHRFQFNHLLGESWILNSNFFMIDGSPIDLAVGAHYLPFAGKTRLMINFLQKLSSDDFIYDYKFRDFARNPENQVRRRFFPLPPPTTPEHGNERLSLFEINPYTQVFVDLYRNMNQKFGFGGSFWLRHVNDRDERGPFDNAFQEYRATADYFPSAAFELSGEYRFRNVTRDDPREVAFFDDIRREGETRFHEVYGNAAYHFPRNWLTVEGGLFYRQFSTQSRLISLNGIDTLGVTGAIKLRLGRGYKLLLEYGIDDELPIINPDVDYTQSFRVRFEWRFNR